ncbi:hypothetical protein NC653_022296 [Populus alba x Populus x berolinensis]|uniref:Uncharacterized protein n=1 Tax=Populus alba x Populus x berolinensis TaxID=444605 RepID=A0AAD6MEX0_9ROSI|nr:hypothetical protein NC653_022286 [Populus alba x Populus x berolinensis]KAJ6984031.1 hypothetical protein NC653_022296 [Populus alba x Populus x berolinensis]
MEDQYTWMENKIDFISCSRPAYVSEEEVHNVILDVILSTNGKQSVCVSREEIRGTPRYLIGSDASLMPMMSLILLRKLPSTPDKYRELSARLMLRPDSLENLSRVDFRTFIDSISAWQNIIRSSVKQRCVIVVGLHLYDIGKCYCGCLEKAMQFSINVDSVVHSGDASLNLVDHNRELYPSGPGALASEIENKAALISSLVMVVRVATEEAYVMVFGNMVLRSSLVYSVPDLAVQQGFMEEAGVPVSKVHPLYPGFLFEIGFLILAELLVPTLTFDESNFSLWGSGEWWMLLVAQSMAVGMVMVRWVSRYSDPVMATG